MDRVVSTEGGQVKTGTGCEQIGAAGTSRVCPSVLPGIAGEKKRLQGPPSSSLKGKKHISLRRRLS